MWFKFQKFCRSSCIVVVFALLGTNGAAQLERKPEHLVTGSYLDLQDAVVSSTIEFVDTLNSRQVYLANANSDGEYSIKLPPGIYEIRLRRGVSYANALRSTVHISDANLQRLNFYLLPECVSFGCRSPGYDFDVFMTEKDSNEYPNLVIAYADKEKINGEVFYKNAVLTFDTYTVKAPEIIQNLRTKATYAKGPGWIENGIDRKPFRDRTDINFATQVLKPNVNIRTISGSRNIKALERLRQSKNKLTRSN